MLSETDRNNLLKDFPNVELSYETIVHKKVYNSEFILAIPEGKKYYAWFTTFKTQIICMHYFFIDYFLCIFYRASYYFRSR